MYRSIAFSKMEILDRVKTILLNPKEEWAVIEAENEPHMSVLTKYLLILALIPAIAFFVGEHLKSKNAYEAFLEINYYRSTTNVERRIEISERIAQEEVEIKEYFSSQQPFRTKKWSIIFAVSLFGIIVGGAYIGAFIISALSKQYDAEKDFNRAFSLVAFSYTPFCVAGILYAFDFFASYVPYIGLYGIYLLHLGIDSQLRPAVDKKSTCFIIALVAVVGIWAGLAKIVAPEVHKKVMMKEIVSKMKAQTGINPIIDVGTKNQMEKDIERQLENHKY